MQQLKTLAPSDQLWGFSLPGLISVNGLQDLKSVAPADKLWGFSTPFGGAYGLQEL
jgi:hypothetical protein